MIFRFNSYTLDPERRTLSRDGDTVVLTSKVFQTLLVLVENHDRVLSKDELCQRIWPNQFVEEANLTQNISVLRRTLDEVAIGRKHIATFHGHGYRFVEPVEVELPAHTDMAAESVEEATPKNLHSTPTASASAIPVWPAVKKPRWLYWVVAAVVLPVVALLVAFVRRPAPVPAKAAPLPPAEVDALTRLPGSQFEPAWSPDGSAFAFIDRAGEAPISTLSLQRRDETAARIIAAGNYQYDSPVWSPDGRSLAAIRAQPNSEELVIFDLAHKTEHKLANLFPHRYGLEYRQLDWSPDGTMIAVDDKETENDPLSLYLVHLADGSRTRLTYPSMDIIGDIAPRFSPDGSTLAFIRIKYQGQNSVNLAAVVGGEPVTLFGPMQVSDVGWLSNDRLLFSARLDDKFRFWCLSRRTPNPKPELAVQAAMDIPVQFTLDPRTLQLAFSAHSSNLDIWAANVAHFTGWRPFVTSPGQDVEPTFSPDGTRVAFRSDVGGHEQLWVSDIDARHAHTVETGDLIPAVHAWDNDDRSLIFKSRYRTGLFETSVDETKPTRQITGLGLSHPARSFDGKIVFARAGHFIFALHRDSGQTDKLTSRGGAPITESADGRFLYFAQGRMESSIARLDLKTLEQKTVLSSLSPGYDDCWALAEKGIYHLGRGHGRPVIAFLDLATGREHVVADFPGDLPPVGYSGFAISPNGKTLLVVRAEPIGSYILKTKLAQY